MAKAKWVISSDDVKSITGKKGDSAAVYDKADLDRRLDAARAAGVRVKVRKAS